MDRGALLFCVALGTVLAALTSVASSKIGEPDSNGAVAAAIKHYLADFVGMEAIEGEGTSFGPMVLCVGSEVPLHMEAIARDLADTVIRPIAEGACRIETVEGDFGMFTAIINYYDASGAEAAHVTVADVSCKNTTTCIVDIDSRGSGDRLEMRRKGRTWFVGERRIRWMV